MDLNINSLTNESQANLNSSTWLFDIASKFSNLTAKHFASAGISTRECNGESEFQLFKLVATFKEILVVAQHDFARRCRIGG
jgi:hypothetical protein